MAVGLPANKKAAKTGGGIAHRARLELESKTGRKVVTGENYLPLGKSKKGLGARPPAVGPAALGTESGRHLSLALRLKNAKDGAPGYPQCGLEGPLGPGHPPESTFLTSRSPDLLKNPDQSTDEV